MYRCIDSYVHICTNLLSSENDLNEPNQRITCTYVYLYTCLCVCLYVSTYVCMYVCIYAYLYMSNNVTSDCQGAIS